MRVRFWGTRGSIPVAPTSADKLWSFIDNDLDFSISQTYGGYQITPNLQRHTGDSYGYRFERDGMELDV
jgi:hypothetical protein